MSNATRRKRSKSVWSYSAGEWGANRVRAYDRGTRGIYLEWSEATPGAGSSRKRCRLALRHRDRSEAKRKADELAAAFRKSEAAPPREVTLALLFDTYEEEVTIQKSSTAQAHDRRCIEMFSRAFSSTRKPSSLSVREWNRFIVDRRTGRIAPAGKEVLGPVRNRTIQQDLRFLLAVLNWATKASDGRGGVLLERNPLLGLPVPREENPRRPVLSDDQFVALRKAAAEVSPWVECFVVLARETGHRAASIRQLRWTDIDLRGDRIHFRGETDKIGHDHWVPLTEAASEALRAEQARSGAIGDAWVFPSARDVTKPRSGDAIFNLWKRIAERAGLPKGERYGWHSCRRAFASSLRGAPLRDLQDLGGWKTAQTVLTCYIRPSEPAQRAALAKRLPVEAVAVSG